MLAVASGSTPHVQRRARAGVSARRSARIGSWSLFPRQRTTGDYRSSRTRCTGDRGAAVCSSACWRTPSPSSAGRDAESRRRFAAIVSGTTSMCWSSAVPPRIHGERAPRQTPCRRRQHAYGAHRFVPISWLALRINELFTWSHHTEASRDNSCRPGLFFPLGVPRLTHDLTGERTDARARRRVQPVPVARLNGDLRSARPPKRPLFGRSLVQLSREDEHTCLSVAALPKFVTSTSRRTRPASRRSSSSARDDVAVLLTCLNLRRCCSRAAAPGEEFRSVLRWRRAAASAPVADPTVSAVARRRRARVAFALRPRCRQSRPARCCRDLVVRGHAGRARVSTLGFCVFATPSFGKLSSGAQALARDIPRISSARTATTSPRNGASPRATRFRRTSRLAFHY